MQTLTKREKIMLYVLLCIIIFAGGVDVYKRQGSEGI